MKNISILGSTGSIGQSTLSVVADYPDRFRVVALTAHRNSDLLLEQIERFTPKLVAVTDPECAARVRAKADMEIVEGEMGLMEVAVFHEADFVVSAIVGAAGLRPTLEAVKMGKTVGLANKEALVVSGELMMSEARRTGARILPVDSEHSAVFQCMGGSAARDIRRLILTASGGPFRGRSVAELADVSLEDALNHPSWSMGRKITIDSATLMNKGLEVIEAHYLFGVPPEHIDVLVHPQSIIHSMVEFRDGSSIAQLSVPDMRGAIAYAMSYPDRLDGVVPALDLAAIGSLTFEDPDPASFPCLGYAFDALKAGGTMPAVLNAANEAAVEAFLDGEAGFTAIPETIYKTMQAHDPVPASDLESVMQAHEWAYAHARGLLGASVR